MERILKDYEQLKQYLEDLQSSVTDDKDFVKLVQLKGVDEDMKETLILLHSNYKTELKSHQDVVQRTLTKVVDNQINLVSSLQKNDNELKATNSNVIHYVNLVKTFIFGVIILVVVFFGLAAFNSDAFKTAFSATKDILNVGQITTQPGAQ